MPPLRAGGNPQRRERLSRGWEGCCAWQPAPSPLAAGLRAASKPCLLGAVVTALELPWLPQHCSLQHVLFLANSKDPRRSRGPAEARPAPRCPLCSGQQKNPKGSGCSSLGSSRTHHA